MATARQQVAAQIRADNAGYIVDDYPNEPKQVQRGKPYVDVYGSDIVQAQEGRLLTHTVEVHAYASRTSGPEAENEAEDIRDNVLLSIQRIPGVEWTRAERVMFVDGKFIGYKITAEASTTNVYKNTITAEG